MTTYTKLSDAELKAKTPEFKERLAKGETLDDLLPEAFAAVREASKRTLSQRHYDVQLIGGIVLHEPQLLDLLLELGDRLLEIQEAGLHGADDSNRIPSCRSPTPPKASSPVPAWAIARRSPSFTNPPARNCLASRCV